MVDHPAWTTIEKRYKARQRLMPPGLCAECAGQQEWVDLGSHDDDCFDFILFCQDCGKVADAAHCPIVQEV